MKVLRLSALRTGRLYPPGNISGIHFCQRPSRPQGHSAAGSIMSVKNSSDTIGNRTRDLPVFSAVPQPTAPPRAPILHIYIYIYTYIYIYILVFPTYICHFSIILTQFGQQPPARTSSTRTFYIVSCKFCIIKVLQILHCNNHMGSLITNTIALYRTLL